MTRNKIGNLKKAITFLEMNDLDHLPWDIMSFSAKQVKIALSPRDIKEEELRVVKRVFHGFTLEDSFDKSSKTARATRKIDDSLTVEFEMNRYMLCTPMKVDDLTDAQWDEVRRLAKNGEIQIPDCQLEEFRTEEVA